MGFNEAAEAGIKEKPGVKMDVQTALVALDEAHRNKMVAGLRLQHKPSSQKLWREYLEACENKDHAEARLRRLVCEREE